MNMNEESKQLFEEVIEQQWKSINEAAMSAKKCKSDYEQMISMSRMLFAISNEMNEMDEYKVQGKIVEIMNRFCDKINKAGEETKGELNKLLREMEE